MAYGPKGCLGDAVNLVAAMTHFERESGDSSERGISRMLQQFGQKVKAGDVSGLWVPTHMAIDGELDDTLAWLLLDKVRPLRRCVRHGVRPG